MNAQQGLLWMIGDMQARVMCATGESPKRMRANRGFAQDLIEELGMPMYPSEPGSCAHLKSYDIEVAGVIVTCDLDTPHTTLVAVA